MKKSRALLLLALLIAGGCHTLRRNDDVRGYLQVKARYDTLARFSRWRFVLIRPQPDANAFDEPTRLNG